MNTQKLQSLGTSIYRREFQASQNRTYSSRTATPVARPHPKENEFELELQKALEGFADPTPAYSDDVQ
jgi:hypothetical protein